VRVVYWGWVGGRLPCKVDLQRKPDHCFNPPTPLTRIGPLGRITQRAYSLCSETAGEMPKVSSW
jgi:hypothetical protein